MTTMYEDYLSKNNLEQIAGCRSREFFGMPLKNVGLPVDHFRLLAHNDVPVEFQSEPYRDHLDRFGRDKIRAWCRKNGFNVCFSTDLAVHYPGRTEVIAIRKT